MYSSTIFGLFPSSLCAYIDLQCNCKSMVRVRQYFFSEHLFLPLTSLHIRHKGLNPCWNVFISFFYYEYQTRFFFCVYQATNGDRRTGSFKVLSNSAGRIPKTVDFPNPVESVAKTSSPLHKIECGVVVM